MDDKRKTWLVDLFKQAIGDTFPAPTPLIGEKWFQFHDRGKPAQMVFTGAPKLAKATGSRVNKVVQMIRKNLKEKPNGLSVTVDDRDFLLVNIPGQADEAPGDAGQKTKKADEAKKAKKAKKSSKPSAKDSQ